MQTTWFIQGESLNLMLGNLELPAAALSSFDTISVLIFIPIMDYGVYPLIRKIFGRSPTQLQRIGKELLHNTFMLNVCHMMTY